jgi:integrase
VKRVRQPDEPVDVIAANRHGQQLMLADTSSSKNGYRPSSRPLAPTPAATPSAPGKAARQLDLFAPLPIVERARRYGFPDPPDAALAARLDRATCYHAARHGWSPDITSNARTAIRVLLGMRDDATIPIRSSEVAALVSFRLPVRSVLAVLAELDILEEDRVTNTEIWFERQILGLPAPMIDELGVWFGALYRGSATPPRSRPRAPVTIRTRLRWALPTLRTWAHEGHQSLREISREQIITALPPGGNPRATLGRALRSIFATLKAHKVVFLNPTARIDVGSFTRHIPLPADPARLQAALNSTDPTAAALAALTAFHGLRPVELRELQLSDVRDGRLHLTRRALPLAQPVRTRLAAYLDYRNHRWPGTINPHFFISYLTAGTLQPTTSGWVNKLLGMSAQAIRQGRIVDETQATAGDLRRICDFFGVTMATAVHYASVLNHPALTDMDPGDGAVGWATEGLI